MLIQIGWDIYVANIHNGIARGTLFHTHDTLFAVASMQREKKLIDKC